MPVLSMLILATGLLFLLVRRDRAEYALFKNAKDSLTRISFYRRWLLKSFGCLGAFSLVALLLLQRLDALTAIPPEFRGLEGSIWSRLGDGTAASVSGEFLLGFFVAGAVAAIAIAVFVQTSGSKSRSNGVPQIELGDIGPMLPRNRREMLWAGLLALNAGFSEELFFRLLLPLMLILLGLPSGLAFIIALLVFGAIHLYQGLTGVVATTVIGAFLTGLYLVTGSIWIAILAHILINLNGLVLRPLLAWSLAEREVSDH